MAYVRAFALIGADGKKIKGTGCRPVRVPHGDAHGGEPEQGDVRFGPNASTEAWPVATHLAALDEDFDVIGEPAPLPEPIAVAPHHHLVVGFTLIDASAVTHALVEVDDCYVARGAKPGEPRGGGPSHTIHVHERARTRDAASRREH